MTRTLSIVTELSRAEIISANDSLHWAERRKKVAALRDRGRVLAHNWTLKHRPYFQRAELRVAVTWPDRRKRDAGNIQPTLKAIVDGFVDKGLLPDDDDEHFRGPYPYATGDVTKNGLIRLGFYFETFEAVE